MWSSACMCICLCFLLFLLLLIYLSTPKAVSSRYDFLPGLHGKTYYQVQRNMYWFTVIVFFWIQFKIIVLASKPLASSLRKYSPNLTLCTNQPTLPDHPQTEDVCSQAKNILGLYTLFLSQEYSLVFILQYMEIFHEYLCIILDF